MTVYATTAALFTLVAGSLGVRMAQGQDPSLGAKQQVAAVQPHKVLVRKVVITRRITVVKPPKAAAQQATSGLASTSAPAPSSSAPAQSYSAPAQTSAPTPTPAPAPAPAPAPVATATS
jgi:hypothetical protein